MDKEIMQSELLGPGCYIMVKSYNFVRAVDKYRVRYVFGMEHGFLHTRRLDDEFTTLIIAVKDVDRILTEDEAKRLVVMSVLSHG